jgi:uncharacterized protein
MLSRGQQVVVLCNVSAQRRDQNWSSPEVHVWRVVNGQAMEFREYQGINRPRTNSGRGSGFK